MDTYKINFSKETGIGGAYDEFHHEIAQIQREEEGIKIEFRSSDYNQLVQKIGEYRLQINFEDSRYIEVSQDIDEIFLDINGKNVDVRYPEFSFNDYNGAYNYKFIDDTNLVLETDSKEIVLPIASGLLIMGFTHGI